jgi:hypothetical protein
MEYNNNNTLCLTYDELVPRFLKRDNYHYHRKKGNFIVHGVGGNGRPVMVEYESLPPEVKEAIIKHYGNPYEYLAKQPILDLINWDYEAHKFYTDYILPNGNNLPATDTDAKGKPQINYVERYTNAVSWLNTISQLTNDKRALKRLLNLSVMDFWEIACELILKKSIALPTNSRRLKDKVKAYNAITDIKERYASIIDLSKFGNSHAAKIEGEESEGVLLKLLADPRKHDDTIVASTYNFWAKKAQKPTVTAGAVGYFRRKNEHLIDISREGFKKTYNKRTKEIERERTSAPLLFINADDNCLDLFFEVETWTDGKKKVSKHYRPMLYVIIDTYNDYILGYAVGDTVTHELVYSAFRNALNHIAELTGEYYLPHQLQTDRWGLDVKMKNELGEFYKKLAHFTPQAKHVPQGKYIERSFGTEWHQVLKVMPTNNYAGKNITAKERLSAEYIIEASKNYPNIKDMPAIVDGFINVMRKKANPKTKVSRQAEWLEAFHASAKSQEKRIDAGMKIQLTGVKRPGNPLTITSQGLRPVLEGKKISLDIPDEVIWQHNGKKVDIFYDPQNLNEVVVTDHKGLRFTAAQIGRKMPAALADYQPGDANRLQDLFTAKKAIGEMMTTRLHERLQAVEGIDAQSLLQAGVLLKDVKQGAEADYLESLYSNVKALAPSKTQLPANVEEALDDDDEVNIYDLY